MKPTRVLISGISGRMGQRVLHCLQKDQKQFECVGGVDRSGENYTSFKDIDVPVDAIIDFSHPSLLEELLFWAISKKVKVVTGTTGLQKKEQELLRKSGEEIPLFFAPNMSFGINILGVILKNYLPFFNGFDFRMKEAHHVNKKDKPSGTALHLEKIIEESAKQKLRELEVLREGEELGMHRIEAQSSQEKIIFEHQALSRDVFAKGAVDALTWLLEKPKGFYTVDDYFKIK